MKRKAEVRGEGDEKWKGPRGLKGREELELIALWSGEAKFAETRVVGVVEEGCKDTVFLWVGS